MVGLYRHGWKSTSNQWPPTKGGVPKTCEEDLVTQPWASWSGVWGANLACVWYAQISVVILARVEKSSKEVKGS